MAWQVTSPGREMWFPCGGWLMELLAVRVDSETGDTEFLILRAQDAPRWVPTSMIQGGHSYHVG
jgi:hypothetical protein